jgi:hypothetical protein
LHPYKRALFKEAAFERVTCREITSAGHSLCHSGNAIREWLLNRHGCVFAIPGEIPFHSHALQMRGKSPESLNPAKMAIFYLKLPTQK